MRKILDKMFQNKRLSIILPIIAAIVVYLIFVLFGTAKNKVNLMIEIPVISILWFIGLFLVLFIQVKNTSCPEWFLNIFEFATSVLLGAIAVIETIAFIISGFQNFNLGICLGLISFSAVSWAHSKRTK